MKKGGESQGFEQARFADLLRPFSVCCANPDGVAVRTAAWWTCVVVAAVSLRRTPAGDTTHAVGRPITQRVIVRVKRAEKEPEAEGRACSHIRIPTLFHIACQNQPTKDRFSRELERGFCLQKPSLERFSLKSQLYPPCPQPSQSPHAPAALPAWASAETDILRVRPSADKQ